MELSDIYDRLDTDIASHNNVSVVDVDKIGKSDPAGAWCMRDAAQAMAQTKIGSFICPSDAPYDKHNPFVFMYFFFDAGSSTGYEDAYYWGFGAGAADVFGRTNYAGVAGFLGYVNVPYFDSRRGVFWNRSKVGVRDIADGSSKTLLFGEMMGGRGRQRQLLLVYVVWRGRPGYGLSPQRQPHLGTVQQLPPTNRSVLHGGRRRHVALDADRRGNLPAIGLH